MLDSSSIQAWNKPEYAWNYVALAYLASKLPYNELHLKQLDCKLGYIKLDPNLVQLQASLKLGSSMDLLSLNQAWKLPYFTILKLKPTFLTLSKSTK